MSVTVKRISTFNLLHFIVNASRLQWPIQNLDPAAMCYSTDRAPKKFLLFVLCVRVKNYVFPSYVLTMLPLGREEGVCKTSIG